VRTRQPRPCARTAGSIPATASSATPRGSISSTADDLVKVSGQWVYPLEVERCLAEHPSVRECAVLAVQLPDRRTTLKAFVVPMKSIADREVFTRTLQDHVKKTLLPYKYPRIVEFLDELPKTGTGKIDRQALAKLSSRA
jgi:acyl-coenzyme A synthetase/AMP-(fatty) acid ligase